MKVYLIILFINFNCIVSQLTNNESVLVFNKFRTGLFPAKLGKTIKQVDESDLNVLIETHDYVAEIDYSLSANVIIWKEDEYYNNLWFYMFYAIPINKR
jgi:hypothetical protein